MWNLDSTHVLVSTHWPIIGNQFPGTLALQFDDVIGWSGNIYGDPLSDIHVAKNFLTFRRNGNGFHQDWSGSIVAIPGGLGPLTAFLVGTFTHNDQGCFSWTSEPMNIQ